ncbi:hypothetical protein T440DRAFT_466595 [Plenodomus tracheiphilus IPT5]|uniref:Core domain-containing protein n=1 Tax=Plenodomus tracheiphilus IPT5 TaxID=1408161 RepID=A0A6A7BC91_9PLEO|nr:hypothetical protein T440DRAFT_466595 [Plenodomus tracheiphilus IPT5]
MASPYTMCASCLRAARGGISRAAVRPAAQSARTYSKATATLRPLYLDFLTPSINRTTSHTLRPIAFTQSSQPPSHRTLATATATATATTASPTATPPTATPAHPILNPRTDDSGNPMSISISPRASHRLHTIATKDANPSLALRVSIESGGCHGFQYLMDLCDLSKSPATDEDTVFEGDKGEKIVVDEASLELLNGSTVDYTMELIGSQFKITGIPGATSSCGCGTSFDIKL